MSPPNAIGPRAQRTKEAVAALGECIQRDVRPFRLERIADLAVRKPFGAELAAISAEEFCRSVLVEALLPLFALSNAPPAAIVAITVPSDRVPPIR